ncbi:hypothetical protein EW146_g9150 [Bondarzewia mesenterica]|uniref:Uncharacterized protein n=1 Tax=Bondarzewia mesenterica TaxID=1095465 RepID=A0A4S4L8K6_9AGAM|nr:hypothetical protein EW146_g9150 [Bondarzewia mesenterica]
MQLVKDGCDMKVPQNKKAVCRIAEVMPKLKRYMQSHHHPSLLQTTAPSSPPSSHSLSNSSLPTCSPLLAYKCIQLLNSPPPSGITKIGKPRPSSREGIDKGKTAAQASVTHPSFIKLVKSSQGSLSPPLPSLPSLPMLSLQIAMPPTNQKGPLSPTTSPLPPIPLAANSAAGPAFPTTLADADITIAHLIEKLKFLDERVVFLEDLFEDYQ